MKNKLSELDLRDGNLSPKDIAFLLMDVLSFIATRDDENLSDNTNFKIET